MRATDLLGCDVYTSDQVHLGQVHDLRFETSGDPKAGTWSCRLTGLACGGSSLGHRFGYGTGEMAGPWPLSAIFARKRRRKTEVDWSDISRVGTKRIELQISQAELREQASRR